MSEENIVKIAVVGPSFCGKTGLCNTIAGKTICTKEYSTTIGVDLLIRHFDNNGTKYKLLLWDMAGHERFNSIINPYIESMPVVLYCYSASQYTSFIKMKQRYQLDKESGRLDNKHIVICMCKSESIDKSNHLNTIGEDFAKIHSCDFIATSSSKKIGILELMYALTKKEQKRISETDILLNKEKDTDEICQYTCNIL